MMPYREVHMCCPDPRATGAEEQPASSRPCNAVCPQSHDQEGCLCHGELPQFPSSYSCWRECASWESVIRSGTYLLDSQPCLLPAHASLSRWWLLAPLRGPDCVSQLLGAHGSWCSWKATGFSPSELANFHSSCLCPHGPWPVACLSEATHLEDDGSK